MSRLVFEQATDRSVADDREKSGGVNLYHLDALIGPATDCTAAPELVASTEVS